MGGAVSRWIVIMIIALVLGSLGACASPGVPSGATTPAHTATQPPRGTPTTAYLSGLAYVNSATLVEPVRSGDPYVLEVQGDLPDGCTVIAEVTQVRTATGIEVALVTTRPRDMMCTEALVPFARSIELDTAGLRDGAYTISVGGKELPLVIGARATPFAPASGALGQFVVRPAPIDSVEVSILGTNPARIDVTISGYLTDGCTRLGDIGQSVTGRRIEVTVYTERPRDAMCTQAIVPFTETVMLDTRNLAPGAYTLAVNGWEQELTLP
jgi:hypothetical protein